MAKTVPKYFLSCFFFVIWWLASGFPNRFQNSNNCFPGKMNFQWKYWPRVPQAERHSVESQKAAFLGHVEPFPPLGLGFPASPLPECVDDRCSLMSASEIEFFSSPLCHDLSLAESGLHSVFPSWE
jgi:hypothetical protein